MRRLTLSAITVASGCAFGSVAQAADLPFPPLLAPKPLYVSEFLSGWYIRGDVGYRFYGTPGGSVAGTDFSSASLSNAAAFDLGFGFKASWFRADVTASYGISPHFAGNTAAASPDVQARIKAITTLANGYFDFGGWRGFTPYIGAGIGFSWIQPTDFSATSVPSSVAAGSPGSFDLAWAATAGVSYAVTRNLLVDTSYRYLHIGSPKTNLTGLGVVSYGDANAQEVRVGMRFLID